ncbi:MAG: hypothetical protein KAV82_09800 [Phycisphaerae bacterium]|nr:hypothetical protein [Phycisphaerae bacterium]
MVLGLPAVHFSIADAAGNVMLLARRIAARFIQKLQGRPSLVIAGMLGFALVVVALLPMDVTFSVDRLHQAAGDRDRVAAWLSTSQK